MHDHMRWASAVLQRKHPLDAMSTYLNGFHMYIVSDERFRALPEAEKRLWHSHHYEVKSGILTAPGVPEMAEHAYFNDLVSTYGKTFHTWQYDRDDFPHGIPQLMMGLTDDGQADEAHHTCLRGHE